MENTTNQPRAAVVIPTYNGQRWMGPCLASLKQYLKNRIKIIVVDNGSSDQTIELAKAMISDCKIIAFSENQGFVGACNAGMKWALEQGFEFTALLNNDTFSNRDWLSPLLAQMDENPEIGILSPIQCTYEDNLSPRCQAILRNASTGSEPLVYTDWVEGSCFVIRSRVLQNIGLLDPIFSPAYFEEVDLCRRAIQAGWNVGLSTLSTMFHFGAASSLQSALKQKISLARERNYLLNQLIQRKPSNRLFYTFLAGWLTAKRSAKQWRSHQTPPWLSLKLFGQVMAKYGEFNEKSRRDRTATALAS